MSSSPTPQPATSSSGAVPGLEKYVFLSLVIGAVGLGVSAVGFLSSRPDFFRAYLVAWCFGMGISLGSLCLLMLQYMIPSFWGLSLRRLLEAACSPVVLLVHVALFLPLLLGLPDLYPWADPVKVGKDHVLQFRQPYMNVPWFLGRFAIFFAIWIVMSFFLTRWSAKEDTISDPAKVKELNGAMRYVAAPGLLIYAITMTFAGIDWGMSVNQRWYSTMYGVIFSFGPLLSALVFLTAMLILIRPQDKRLGEVTSSNTIADLGSLTLAFVMFWTYISFSQFLLVWSANLRPEVPYYVIRLYNQHTLGAYGYIGLLLAFGHFVVPFLVLLTGDGRRNPRILLGVALWMLFMRFVDYYWTIGPTLTNGNFNPLMLWLDASTVVGILGIVTGVFLWRLQALPIVPAHDARLALLGGHAHG